MTFLVLRSQNETFGLPVHYPIAGLGGLLEIESELEPVNVMFLYKVIGLIGEIADMAERVGRRLELLLSH